MKNSKSILIVDDDESLRRILEYNLSEEGYTVLTARNGREGLTIFNEQSVDLVLTDIKMPEMGGLELMRTIRASSPQALIIVLTAFGAVDTAVESMKLGAFDYITKPFNREELKVIVKKALEVEDLVLENQYLKDIVHDTYQIENMVGTSSAMQSVYKTTSQVAKADATVLILGENGTGKELLVKGIHLNSLRKEKPFITVNCGALPENLIESELFGHKKGAFTGATHNKKGKFEEADGGTIFLDEIGELQMHLQVKLLRVLQEGMVDKIGEVEQKRVDIRVIAATNKNLEKEVQNGNFREDLYYRLCVVAITIPPLRDRTDDIPLLVSHFLKKYSKSTPSKPVSMDKKVLKFFLLYQWPGNVRELENVLQGMVVLNQTGMITEEDIPDRLQSTQKKGNFLLELPDGGIDLKKVEEEIIVCALEKCEQNQSKTARFLGITRNTLLYRMSKIEGGN